MYHMIIVNAVLFVFLQIKWSCPDWIIIAAVNAFTIAGTLLMAHLSYTHYENYFLNLKTKFRKDTSSKGHLPRDKTNANANYDSKEPKLLQDDFLALNKR